MPFLSRASAVHNLLSLLSLRKPKRNHRQEEDPLINSPSGEVVSYLNEINDKLQSSRTWSPLANTEQDWTSHPFVAWVAEQNEKEGDGWLRMRLFQKRAGTMSLAEKVFLERIHAALFAFKSCSSPRKLYKLLNKSMQCAMGVSLSGWKALKLFPKPPDDTESPSESEEGPDLQKPRNLFDHGSQCLLEEEYQYDDEDDGLAELAMEIEGGEDNTASESELVTLTEISKDVFDDTKIGRQQCAAGMRLCECDGRYFICTKHFVVHSFAYNDLHHRKKTFFAIPSRSDLIDKTARTKSANKATTATLEATALAEDMTKLKAVLSRSRFSSKADGDSRRILAGLVIYLPKLSSLALEQVIPFTLYAMFNEAGVSINADDLFNSCPSRNTFDRMVKDLAADMLVVCG
jgi:hypothetical protein